MSEITQLLQQVKEGNKNAIVQLVEHYMPLVRCNCKFDDPQVSEDCRQYIVLNLIIAIKRFEPVLNFLSNDNSN